MTGWNQQPGAHDIEALYREHAAAVFRCALRGVDGDVEQAKDIVQKVFLAVCAQYDTDFGYRTPEAKAALIMVMAKRRIVDCWRQAARLPETLYAEVNEPARAFGDTANLALAARSDRVMEDAQLKRLWETLTIDLTHTEYRVALMTWDMELSTEAIAEILTTTVSAVRTHRSRARKKMARALDGQAEPAGGEVG